MKLFVQEGRTMKVLADAAKTAGDVEEFTDGVGVWFNDVPNGSSGEVLMEGVIELPKDATVAIGQVKKVYWDGAKIVATASGNKFAGLCWNDAATADATCQVKLNAA